MRSTMTRIIVGTICAVGMAVLAPQTFAASMTVSTSVLQGDGTSTGFGLTAGSGATVTLGGYYTQSSGRATAGAETTDLVTDGPNGGASVAGDAVSAALDAGAGFETSFVGDGETDFNFAGTIQATSLGGSATALSTYLLHLAFSLDQSDSVTFAFDYEAVFARDPALTSQATGSALFRFLLVGIDANGAEQTISKDFSFDSLTGDGGKGLDILTLDGISNGYIEAYYESTASAVPEPSTFLLIGFGLAGVVACRRWTGRA